MLSESGQAAQIVTDVAGRRDDFPQDGRLQELIALRRSVCSGLSMEEHGRSARKEICKEIQRLTRTKVRWRKRAQIEAILTEFVGLKDIASIKGVGSKKAIEVVKDNSGNLVTDEQGIADVFASFYEQLYAAKGEHQYGGCSLGSQTDSLEPFTHQELKAALKSMKRGRAKDESGIIAEMVKDASPSMLGLILDLFNEILCGRSMPPASWKRVVIKVIFKKGDCQLPKNYRPIALIPILYKVFSRMLCERVAKFVVPKQDVEQAAYRKGFSTEDHILAAVILTEQANEFNIPLWLALVDFEKAFDTVDQASMWGALRLAGVPEPYITLLQRLYLDQVGVVQTKRPSKTFPIETGVKQGDPISALLFICIMQQICCELQQKWHSLSRRRSGHPYGIHIGDGSGRALTNLRFADDVLLIGQSKADIRKMLLQFEESARRFGLKLNFDKTTVLTQRRWSNGCQHICMGNSTVQILNEDASERCLGRTFCLRDGHRVEHQHRISSAWAAFHKYKSEICSKHYPVKARVRLFESIVTPVPLYGCAAWALTGDLEKSLQTHWRKMARYLFRIHRRHSEETWIEYLQRSARAVDELGSKHCMKNWVHEARRRKWKFAGETVRWPDNRWSKMLLSWKPSSDYRRAPGHPWTRWSDDIVKFAGETWTTTACDEGLWAALCEGYAQSL